MFDAVKVETPKFRLYVIHMGMYSYKDLQRKSLFISFYLFLRTSVNDHEYMEFTSHKNLQTELLRRQQLSFAIGQFHQPVCLKIGQMWRVALRDGEKKM